MERPFVDVQGGANRERVRKKSREKENVHRNLNCKLRMRDCRLDQSCYACFYSRCYCPTGCLLPLIQPNTSSPSPGPSACDHFLLLFTNLFMVLLQASNMHLPLCTSKYPLSLLRTKPRAAPRFPWQSSPRFFFRSSHLLLYAVNTPSALQSNCCTAFIHSKAKQWHSASPPPTGQVIDENRLWSRTKREC